MNIRTKMLMLIILIVTAIGGYFIIQFYSVFFKENTLFNNENSYLFIDRDDTIDSVAVQLAPMLKSVDLFLVAANKKGYSQNIKAGKYSITRNSNNNDIINSLRSQRQLVNVVFNNQERLEDLAGRVAQQIEPDSLELLSTFRDPQFLKENGFTPENALAMYLPNSYQFYWETTPENFQKKMLNEYQRFWNEERSEKAQELNLSPQEVATLASIVQKETNKAEERSRVAGVYINRLRKNILLHADPTVVYALKKELNNFDTIFRRVLYKDLKVKSPYNTYKNRGLPPGPIFMADLSTIDAVLNFEKHKLFYFVVNPHRPGYHLFASSLREHNRNKKVYTDWLNKRRLYR